MKQLTDEQYVGIWLKVSKSINKGAIEGGPIITVDSQPEHG